MGELTSKRGAFKALIFDLDDTLFDTSGMLVRPALREAAAAMALAGLNATPEECAGERARFLKHNPRGDLFEHLIKKFGLKDGAGATPEQVREVGAAAFYSRDLKNKIFPYPGVRELLADLSARYLTFLVTIGDPKVQKKKVAQLGIGGFFSHISYIDSSKDQTKSGAFIRILRATGLKPNEVLCIGNRLDLEIAQGKALGLETCLVQAGDYREVSPRGPLEYPDFKIDQISEIMETCRL